jgi:hypothetical protein
VCVGFSLSPFTSLDNLLEVQSFVRGVSELGERIHCSIFFFYFRGKEGEGKGGKEGGGKGGNGGNFVISFFSFFFFFFLFSLFFSKVEKGCWVNGLRLPIWLHYLSCG